MKILDRYILKNFLLDFLICLVTLMALCVIVETFEKASEFAEYFGDQKKAGEPMQRSPFQAIGRYYLLHLPILYGQVSPIILLMAAMFTVTRMGRFGEFIPLKASGISLYRVLLPILVVAVILSGISVVIQEILVPRLSDSIRDSELISEGGGELISSFQRIDSDGNVYFFSRYSTIRQTGLGIRVVQRYPPELGGRKKATIKAQFGRFQRTEKGYALLLSDGVIEHFDPESGFRMEGSPQRFGLEGVSIVGGLEPIDILRSRSPETLTLRPMADLVREVEENPSLAEARVALHSRYAQPLSGIILLFLGLPFVLGSENRNVFLGAMIAVMIAVAFFGINLLGVNLGRKGILPPVAAVWLPLLLFVSLGAAFIDRVRT